MPKPRWGNSWLYLAKSSQNIAFFCESSVWLPRGWLLRKLVSFAPSRFCLGPQKQGTSLVTTRIHVVLCFLVTIVSEVIYLGNVPAKIPVFTRLFSPFLPPLRATPLPPLPLRASSRFLPLKRTMCSLKQGRAWRGALSGWTLRKVRESP